MKTTTISEFFTAYRATVQRLMAGVERFQRLNVSYVAVDLGTSIADGTDFGASAGTTPLLIPWFAELKATTKEVLGATYTHRALLQQYTALDLGTLIGDAVDLGGGVTGAELKAALTSMTDLDALLGTGHYTNLCRMEYTAPKQADEWVVGITGAQVKAVITSLAAIVADFTTDYDWGNLYRIC